MKPILAGILSLGFTTTAMAAPTYLCRDANNQVTILHVLSEQQLEVRDTATGTDYTAQLNSDEQAPEGFTAFTGTSGCNDDQQQGVAHCGAIELHTVAVSSSLLSGFVRGQAVIGGETLNCALSMMVDEKAPFAGPFALGQGLN